MDWDTILLVPKATLVGLAGGCAGFAAALIADTAAQVWELECSLDPVVGEDCGYLECRRTFRVAVSSGGLGTLVDVASDFLLHGQIQLTKGVHQFGSWFFSSAALADLSGVFVNFQTFTLTSRPPKQVPIACGVNLVSRIIIQLLCYCFNVKYWQYFLLRCTLPVSLLSYFMFLGTRGVELERKKSSEYRSACMF